MPQHLRKSDCERADAELKPTGARRASFLNVVLRSTMPSVFSTMSRLTGVAPVGATGIGLCAWRSATRFESSASA